MAANADALVVVRNLNSKGCFPTAIIRSLPKSICQADLLCAYVYAGVRKQPLLLLAHCVQTACEFAGVAATSRCSAPDLMQLLHNNTSRKQPHTYVYIDPGLHASEQFKPQQALTFMQFVFSGRRTAALPRLPLLR